jgi:hypothetical protein
MRRLIAAVLAGLVLAPLASAATKGPVFGLRAVGNPKRGYFIYTLEPGGMKHGAVIVSNTGTAPGTVKLFPADATTGKTSGTVYLTDQKPTKAGAWIKLEKSELTLAPGAHRQVGFTVDVPKGTDAGQWVGGIVAETTHQVTGPKSKQKANVQIRIRDLTIVAVQVNVPGTPVISLKVGDVTTGGQHGFQQVITSMQNAGNVLVKPFGTITILDSAGKTLQALRFKMDTFLPQTAIDYPVLLKRALPPGSYQAVVKVTVPGVAGVKGTRVNVSRPLSVSKQDVQQVFTSAAPTLTPPGATASSGTSSKDHPWLLIVLIAAVVVLLFAALLWWLRRRRRAAETTPAAPEPILAPAAVEERTAPPPAPEPAPVPEEAFPASEPAPWPEPGEPAEPLPPPPPPSPAAATPDHEHLWEVAYAQGELGDDGVWRFPHHCRTCGAELLARDVADATAQTDR